MRIFNSLDQLNISGKTAVALGNFDGLHIGHQRIMENAVRASSGGMKSLCFTFSNHPFNFILDRQADDPAAIKLICSEDEKIRLIEQMGFDILVNVPFDESIMTMRAHRFFEDILLAGLNAGYISVGFNYSYGARAEGKPDMLLKECAGAGIGCNVHDAVKADGRIVSSTLIREMISVGNMEAVSKYLGRPLMFGGTVEHGNRIGSSEGYPTANIPVGAERMLPPSGVYFTRTEIDGRMYNGVSNLGVKPTIGGERTKSIETNIFSFGGDLYGKNIRVHMDHFSRAEVKFPSRDALFEQIARDRGNAEDYYKNR